MNISLNDDLLLAINENNYEKVCDLLKKGADPNCWKGAPLANALYRKDHLKVPNEKIIDVLKSHGAKCELPKQKLPLLRQVKEFIAALIIFVGFIGFLFVICGGGYDWVHADYHYYDENECLLLDSSYPSVGYFYFQIISTPKDHYIYNEFDPSSDKWWGPYTVSIVTFEKNVAENKGTEVSCNSLH